MGAFLDDLFVLEMQGSKFGTLTLSVFRNLVRENGWRRDCQCFFSAFKCSQQQLLCWSGEWSDHLSLCACEPAVGCGSVDKGKTGVKRPAALASSLLYLLWFSPEFWFGIYCTVNIIIKEVFEPSLSGFGKLRVDSWLCQFVWHHVTWPV